MEFPDTISVVEIGKTQRLTLARLTSVGAYLTDGRDDVLMPKKYVPPSAQLGETVEAFVYLDSEDRPIATTQKPKAEVDSFAYLRCVGTSNVGAFLDFGLEKDLLVPFREQLSPMREEQGYVVRVFLDEVSGRLVGSSKLRKFLSPPSETLVLGTEMPFLISEVRPRALIGVADDRYDAVVLEDELPREVMRVGRRLNAWLKKVSPEGVQLALRPIGRRAELGGAEQLLVRLKEEGGFLGLNDDSSPEEIQRKLGLSKSAFKRILGHLLKEGRIDMDPYGIRLRA